jgi:hypothetical protein
LNSWWYTGYTFFIVLLLVVHLYIDASCITQLAHTRRKCQRMVHCNGTSSDTSASELAATAEKDGLLEAQRVASERVPTLMEHVEIGKNTGGCRISDFSSALFKTVGPKADKLRRDLVSAASVACRSRDFHGCFTEDEAKAVVAELLVAANNELAPSENTEVFFGISEPDWQHVADTLGGAGNGLDFDDACVGLLAYRAWKILIRVPVGRAVLLTDGAACVEEMDPDLLNSFDAVQSTIAKALVEDSLCEKFIQWVSMLPTSKVMNNTVLSPKETQFLLNSIKSGHLDWHSTHTTVQSGDQKWIYQ